MDRPIKQEPEIQQEQEAVAADDTRPRPPKKSKLSKDSSEEENLIEIIFGGQFEASAYYDFDRLAEHSDFFKAKRDEHHLAVVKLPDITQWEFEAALLFVDGSPSDVLHLAMIPTEGRRDIEHALVKILSKVSPALSILKRFEFKAEHKENAARLFSNCLEHRDAPKIASNSEWTKTIRICMNANVGATFKKSMARAYLKKWFAERKKKASSATANTKIDCLIDSATLSFELKAQEAVQDALAILGENGKEWWRPRKLKNGELYELKESDVERLKPLLKDFPEELLPPYLAADHIDNELFAKLVVSNFIILRSQQNSS